jgi:hypothetical protein
VIVLASRIVFFGAGKAFGLLRLGFIFSSILISIKAQRSAWTLFYLVNDLCCRGTFWFDPWPHHGIKYLRQTGSGFPAYRGMFAKGRFPYNGDLPVAVFFGQVLHMIKY